MTTAWTAAAVDDEPPALQRLATLLASFDEVQLVGTYSDAQEALAALQRVPVDLLFLDIQMPGLTGLDLATALGERPPLIVFVTAHEEHALDAFAAQAFDYLLKPIARVRFRKTMERVLRRLEVDASASLYPRMRTLLAALEPPSHGPVPPRIAVRAGEAHVLLDAVEIDRVEVTGNTLRVFVGTRTYEFRDTLSAFETRLPPGRFLRVHRSILVNVDRIRRAEPWFHGDLALVLADGTRVVTGRTYREQIRRALGL